MARKIQTAWRWRTRHFHELVRRFLKVLIRLHQRNIPGSRRSPLELYALTKPVKKARPTLREDVVRHRLKRLEETLGNDSGFTAAFNELDQDPNIGRLEIAERAKRFTQKASKSRPGALKKIWARHHALMMLKANSESRAGRSAA
jgi:hypothetical protein